MKQLKSSLQDLRHFFSRTITLRDIAEPLASFDHAQLSDEVLGFMETKGYDVVGVRVHGLVTGYVVKTELEKNQPIGKFRKNFEDEQVFSDGEALLSVLTALRDCRHIFVRVLGHVGGIATRGDLQKAPVRMWLFGLVSLFEMQILRVIRERYPAGTWTSLLTLERVERAREIFEKRKQRNEENDLSDCLQLGDKGRIFVKDAILFELTGFSSKQALEAFFNDTASLRDALAHSNDITSNRWASLSDLIKELERTLETLEKSTVSCATDNPVRH